MSKHNVFDTSTQLVHPSESLPENGLEKMEELNEYNQWQLQQISHIQEILSDNHMTTTNTNTEHFDNIAVTTSLPSSCVFIINATETCEKGIRQSSGKNMKEGAQVEEVNTNTQNSSTEQVCEGNDNLITETPCIRPEYSKEFLETDGVSNLPEHLLPLAHEIHLLEPHDLALIADVAYTVASRDVYSLLPYTGSNWYLPSIRECRNDEPHWELHYNWNDGLIIALGGRRLSIMLLNIIIRLALIVLTWFMLWNILPHWLMEPGGYVWDPLVLVVISSLIGGLLCRILQIPPLVGVLWIGIMWNNIPTLHYLTSGIDKHVFDIASKLGLTVILLRAGYSMSWRSIKPHWRQSCMLATLPFALEGITHSLIANKVFHYNNNYNWAFLQGMLCSIASPAVVVPGALYLQELGYGRQIGPLTLMLSAIGVEIGIGVWCANFIIGLIFYNQKLSVAIALGPVQFIGGIFIGALIGVIYFFVVEVLKNEAHRLPSGKFQRDHFHSTLNLSYVIMLFAAFAMVFLGYGVSLAGGGCIMAMTFAASVAHMWIKDGKRELEEQKKYIAGWLAFTWDHVMLPVLFATMGAKIDIKAIFNSDFFPKAIICLVCSTCCRLIVIFVIQLGDGMSWKDKVVVCVGYLGKASAQASIGPIAANLVTDLIALAPPNEVHKYDQMKKYANNVQQMSALYVMFMAAIASISLVRGGQLLMTKVDDDGHDHKSDLTSSSSSERTTAVEIERRTVHEPEHELRQRQWQQHYQEEQQQEEEEKEELEQYCELEHASPYELSHSSINDNSNKKSDTKCNKMHLRSKHTDECKRRNSKYLFNRHSKTKFYVLHNRESETNFKECCNNPIESNHVLVESSHVCNLHSAQLNQNNACVSPASQTNLETHTEPGRIALHSGNSANAYDKQHVPNPLMQHAKFTQTIST